VVRLGDDDGTEPGVELHLDLTINQFAEAKILEPVLRALHTIEPTMRSVGERHG
jgi:hypothetical protein